MVTLGFTSTGRAVPIYSQQVNWGGEDSGFPGPEAVSQWQSNCCGIACARMIIDAFTGTRVGYWDLLQEGLAAKAYNDVGWIHRGLVDLIGTHGVAGTDHRGKDLDDLVGATQRGSLCIASVTVGFRGGLAKPGRDVAFAKGGHLVVAFQNANGALSCHHPSSLDEGNQVDWVVSEDAWRRSFSGGFMEFSAP